MRVLGSIALKVYRCRDSARDMKHILLSEPASNTFSCLLDSVRKMGLIRIDSLGVSSCLFFGLYFLLPNAHEPSTRSAMALLLGGSVKIYVHHNHMR